MDSFLGKTLWVMRHGRPDIPHNPFFMNKEQFNSFLAAYDRAGLSEEEKVRLSGLYQAYPHPDLVITSDLPRAVDTAKIFARTSQIIIDPIFREIPVWLPLHSTPFLNARWPREFWWSYLRYDWFKDREPEGRTKSLMRAQEALERLYAYQAQADRLALVSHAGFLMVLINILHQRKQIRGRRLPSITFGKPTRYTWTRSSHA